MGLKKSGLTWCLVLMLSLSLALPVMAGSNSNSSASGADVQKLVHLGLIKGDGRGVTNSYLNKPATRLQAAILYLRLTGLEQEALSYAGKPNQAIITYMEEHPHLFFSTSNENRFELQEPITGNEFASMLLRALGYEPGVDYKDESAITFAAQQGLTMANGDARLSNRDIVASTYQALSLKTKLNQMTLLEKWTERMNKENVVPDTAVRTKYGELQGMKITDSSTISWLGVPYAKPPVGELRWKAPQNPEPWTGSLETVQFGQSCTQTVEGKITGSEDCLYLNIWRPDQASTHLPVFVFAHGGGNVGGAGNSFVGDRLADATNSIIISINYRLGAFGFFRHPALQTGDAADDSGNFGLLDIIQSLKWVQDNIESFGGNPENVTLAGQSAGGRDVLAAVISPYAEGLFQKAVVLSGGMTTADPKAGEAKAEDALLKLAIADGKAASEDEAKAWMNKLTKDELASYLRQSKPEDIAVYYTDPAIRMEPFPHLFRDGAVIPEEGFDRITSGEYNKVPILLGSEQTEFSGFAFGDPYFNASAMDGSLFNDAKKLKQYQAAVHYGSELYAGFNVERVAEKLTSQKDQPAVYGYRFAWGTRDGVIAPHLRMLFGAAHGADLDFYTGHPAGLSMYFGKDYFNDDNKAGRQELSAAMNSYLKHFLYTGNPNNQQAAEWKPWHAQSGKERILRLDAEKDHAVIEMSDEYFIAEDTTKRMKSELGEEDLELLVQNVFAGRFFWE